MYQLKQESIFDQKCDLVIIPCNSYGRITHSVENDLIGYAASVLSLSRRVNTVAMEYVHNICVQNMNYFAVKTKLKKVNSGSYYGVFSTVKRCLN